MTIREQYVIPKKYNTLSLALMAVGIISIIILFITHGAHGGHTAADQQVRARFWASLLQNSVYFLLITNAIPATKVEANVYQLYIVEYQCASILINQNHGMDDITVKLKSTM